MKGKKRKNETILGVNIRAMLSTNLRKFRKDANLSQILLAEKASLAPNFVNDIENGRKWVSPESLGKLANALKVEPHQFFIGEQQWGTQGKEYLALFISDVEKISKDYKDRYLQESAGKKAKK